jgi:iron uptake system component EfeO
MGSLRSLVLPLGALLLGAACSSKPSSDTAHREAVIVGMRTVFVSDLANLVSFSQMLQTAAPTSTARGWDVAADADAIAAMKVAWTGCRAAYEHLEGATAPLFPDIDATIDTRYDDFLAALPGGDPYLFDDLGVTGMHAIERILFSSVTSARVVSYEATLPGDVASAFPGTAREASDFKTLLVGKQIADAQALQTGWENAPSYDLGAVFQGLVSLMGEQQEKIDRASTSQEESRYAQTTLLDIRNNLAGTERVYALFQPWIQSKSGVTFEGDTGDPGATQDGKTIDAAIEAGFAALQTLYDSIQGDAVPLPPDSWSSVNPTATDLATPYGTLYEGVHQAVDPNQPGSIVAQMNAAAVLLDFPQFVAE